LAARGSGSYDECCGGCYGWVHDGSTLRDAALSLGYISAQEFDRVTDPASMVGDARIGEL